MMLYVRCTMCDVQCERMYDVRHVMYDVIAMYDVRCVRD